MKSHSASRTYDQGDKCYIYHTIDDITQKYTFESLGVQKGSFSPAMWRNLTPRAWRLDSLNFDDYVYEGDTVFVGNTGYKNDTGGIKYIREFTGYAIPAGSAYFVGVDGLIEINAESGIYSGNYIRDMFPQWAGWSRDFVLYLGKIDRETIVKITNVVPADNQVQTASTFLRNRIGFLYGNYDKGSYPGGSVSDGADFVYYDLPTSADDYQYFIISNDNGTINISSLPANTPL